MGRKSERLEYLEKHLALLSATVDGLRRELHDLRVKCNPPKPFTPAAWPPAEQQAIVREPQGPAVNPFPVDPDIRGATIRPAETPQEWPRATQHAIIRAAANYPKIWGELFGDYPDTAAYLKAVETLTDAVDAFEETGQINADDEAHDNMVNASDALKAQMAALKK